MLAQIESYELVLFAGALLVAAYMFAAIRFPALRFIFGLRAGVARAVGADHEKNKAIGQSLGLILCPIIGVLALIFAFNIAGGWFADHKSEEQSSALDEQLQQRDTAELTEMLRSWEIDGIYYDRWDWQHIGVSDQGTEQVQEFWEELRQAAVPPDVVIDSRKTRDLDDTLRLLLKPSDGSAGLAEVAFLFDEGHAVVTHTMKESRLPPNRRGFVWDLPDAAEDGFASLSRLERVDIREMKRLAAIAKRKENNRLDDYQEKTYAGLPTCRIYDLVHDLPEDQRQSKIESLIGRPFDWECEVESIQEDDGGLIYQLSQNRLQQDKPTSGRVWLVYCRIPDEEAGGWPSEATRVFVRIKGEILAIDNGIHVRVSEVQQFSP